MNLIKKEKLIAKKVEREPNRHSTNADQTWRPIVLGCLFVFFGLQNLYIALVGGGRLYAYDLGELGTILIFGFAFLFFGVGWGFFNRKKWVLNWGYCTGWLQIIGGFLSESWFLIIVGAAMALLTNLSKDEFIN